MVDEDRKHGNQCLVIYSYIHTDIALIWALQQYLYSRKADQEIISETLGKCSAEKKRALKCNMHILNRGKRPGSRTLKE